MLHQESGVGRFEVPDAESTEAKGSTNLFPIDQAAESIDGRPSFPEKTPTDLVHLFYYPGGDPECRTK